MLLLQVLPVILSLRSFLKQIVAQAAEMPIQLPQ